MTSSYEGNELFVSLKAPRKPIVAGTINSLTTTFLRSVGVHDFTAHSKEGPYQDRPLLYPFHHFLSLLWSCFSPGSA